MRLPATSESDELSLNLTPVIDVVFLLLIFFLVASRFDKQERELNVALPEVAKAQPLSLTQDLIINVTSEGKFLVLQKEVKERDLMALLQKAKENNPHQRVLIRGDGRSAWRHGVRAMGLCNAVDIKDIRVAALEEN